MESTQFSKCMNQSHSVTVPKQRTPPPPQIKTLCRHILIVLVDAVVYWYYGVYKTFWYTLLLPTENNPFLYMIYGVRNYVTELRKGCKPTRTGWCLSESRSSELSWQRTAISFHTKSMCVCICSSIQSPQYLLDEEVTGVEMQNEIHELVPRGKEESDKQAETLQRLIKRWSSAEQQQRVNAAELESPSTSFTIV